jgi:hypothetical protein
LEIISIETGVAKGQGTTPRTLLIPLRQPDQAIAKVTKQGLVFYLHDKAVIKDDGHRVHVAADSCQEAIKAALIHAKQRHGYQPSVQGGNMFQENMVRASVNGGLNISFEQEHLERRRVQLNAEMYLFVKGAVTSLNLKQSLGVRR